MLTRWLRTTVLTISMGIAACAPVPMIDPPTVAIPVGASQSDITRAVVNAAVAREWTVIDKQADLVMLRYAPRNFSVTVAVTHDDRTITIAYQESHGLDYGRQNGATVIHGNYNRWVDNLAQDIRRELAAETAR